MRRASVVCLSLAALTACAPPVPDSGAGVGFGSYAEYQAQREAQLIANGEGRGQATTGLNTQQIAQTATAAIEASQAPAASTQAATTTTTTPTPTPARPGQAVTNSIGISSENNFDAVSTERSIEEDAARVAANKESYVTIQPTAVPARPSGSGATLVQFALSTRNNVGQPIYSRAIPGAASRAARNCLKYASPDLAQEDFLKNGGPEKNAKGLDPDGDGFACSWDPAPFRLAAQNR